MIYCVVYLLLIFKMFDGLKNNLVLKDICKPAEIRVCIYGVTILCSLVGEYWICEGAYSIFGSEMEEVCSSEAPVHTYQNTQCQSTEKRNAVLERNLCYALY
jgi:hypothetical protein